MKRILLLAVLMVAVIAAPAFASVQNIKVSGDIDSTWLIRDNFDLGSSASTTVAATTEARHQNLFITQTRLRVDADLTDNVSATVALINERDWDTTEGAGGTNVDLNLAFVELREMLYSPLTVKVGRQTFSYGNSFIIGAGGENLFAGGNLAGVAADLTKATAYDGAKAILDYDPLTIDVIYMKAGNATPSDAAGRSDDDIDVYGINANYELGDEMGTVIEGYFFARHDNSLRDNAAGAGATVGHTKADTLYVPGLRVSTNPIKGLNFQAEFAWQRGNKASASTTFPPGVAVDNFEREAHGAQAIVNYMLPMMEEYNPVVTGVYTWVSGDKNALRNARDTNLPASEEKWTAWDPFFEDQAGGKIYNSLFQLSNAHIYMIQGSMTPMEDVTTTLSWTGIWLDKEFETGFGTQGTTVARFVQPDGGLVYPTVTNDEEVGHEFDVDITYDYTEDVQLGLNLGWFIAGDAFANDTSASQILTSVAVAF